MQLSHDDKVNDDVSHKVTYDVPDDVNIAIDDDEDELNMQQRQLPQQQRMLVNIYHFQHMK